jgi:hypothetical protein
MSVFQQHLSVIADMKTGLITHNRANWNDFATRLKGKRCFWSKNHDLPARIECCRVHFWAHPMCSFPTNFGVAN